MYYLSMDSRDIRVNLATEDYLLTKWDKPEPLILFYIQEPSIIIGRNQDYFAELNLPYVLSHQITVTRRLSGGGAVYDDLGNLSFSIVTQKGARFGQFKELTQPILTALHQLGAVGATLTGRNDLVIDGRKFSGNAMYQNGHKLFCHGTLMYNVDLSVLPKALAVAPEKLQANKVQSVRSRVTNLNAYLSPEYQDLSTEEFRDHLIRRLFGVNNLLDLQDRAYSLTSEEKQDIDTLVKNKYGNQQWIQGSGNSQLPPISVKKRFPIGTIEIRFNLIANHLQNVAFYGDFFHQADTLELAEALNQIAYNVEAITTALEPFNLARYFGPITLAELTHLILREANHD